MITHKDFEALGFQFGESHKLGSVNLINRGVCEATIIHTPANDGKFKLYGPIRAGYGAQNWHLNEPLCAVFTDADELYAYLIEQTLRRGLTFTQLAAGDEK